MKNKKGITLIALIITIIVMLILVGVTVNVGINGGLFSAAKQAASGMQMAQIRERAEVVKATLIAEAQTDSSIILSKQTYKDRLLQEFEGSTAIGNKVIVEDGKYDIIIKNVNLDIEVVEHSDSTEPTSLIALGYTTSNIEEDGKVYVTNVELSLSLLMNSTQYEELRAKEDVSNGEEMTTEEMKRQTVIKYLSEAYGEQFTSIEEAIVYEINNNWCGTSYTTIEECLQDETVQADWGTTKEQIYYNFYYLEFSGEGKEMTEEEMIEAFYRDAIADKYITEFNKYTRNLSVYVEKDGVQELIKSTINVGTSTTTLTYSIGENGIYEFVVKTKDGEEVARERIQINNIATPNPYVLTKEEAEGVWTTDGAGTITGYTGQESNIAIPAMIGTELITKIGSQAFYKNSNIITVKIPGSVTLIGGFAFGYCGNLTSVDIPDSVVDISGYAFSKCTSLSNIEIPNSVTEIGQYAFEYCSNLEEITIPNSVTVIESGTFRYCYGLKTIILSNQLTKIKYVAFWRCTSLERISIPANVTLIDQQAFGQCSALREIALNEGLTTIGENAFKGCIALTTITIPNSVTSLGLVVSSWNPTWNSFENCTNLININFAPGDNPIPDGQPWGAPNENLVVTKLTE